MIVEILIFFLAAICGLFITGFAVHMFIGGLVSTDAENQVIVVVCCIVACVIAYMAWDVVKKRSGKNS
jgi:hypothetical protein